MVPFHFLASLACAILSVPIESDQRALEKAQTLLAFSLLGPSFLFWPEKGWKEGARKGRASCCVFALLRMPNPGAGGLLPGALSVALLQKEQAKEVEGENSTSPVTKRNSECAVQTGARQSPF